MLKPGINHLSNADYHADTKYISSSGLKQVLEDAKKFHKEKILGQREKQESKAAFDEGSLVHALILEPEVIDNEFAFFPGMRKQGAEWETFKEQNKGKVLLSQPQKLRCEYYVESYQKLEVAKHLIAGGFSEHTICGTYLGVDLKVRCDYINIDKGYIADVKTSSFPVDKDSFSMTVEQWKYELSAALYCKIAELHYGKPFEFYFIAISKREQDCQVYKLSKARMNQGLLAVNKACKLIKSCLESGVWENEQKSESDFGDYEIIEI